MKELHKQFDVLQQKYGAKELNAIYGGGCENQPKFCFVFMNPTGTNVASNKGWEGIRYPWLGTKNIWKLLSEIGVITNDINAEIQSKKSQEWTPEFCEKVYNEVTNSQVYITNLAKCTQLDARHLEDKVYIEYLKLFQQEIEKINPKTIILFGNQVSSIVLNENIKVGEERKKERKYGNAKAFAVFYPVGNGRFNMPKAVEDLKWIMQN